MPLRFHKNRRTRFGLPATIGLYGVIACSVSRRTREMGIRISVGASFSQVVALAMKGVVAWMLADGLVPAYRAARIDPVRALRHE